MFLLVKDNEQLESKHTHTHGDTTLMWCSFCESEAGSLHFVAKSYNLLKMFTVW